MGKIDIELPPLYKWQQEIYDSPARFKVIAVGRRAGKTHLGVITAFATAYTEDKVVIWLSPSHGQSREGWRQLSILCRQLDDYAKKTTGKVITKRDNTNKTITFADGEGVIYCKTGDNPDLLRSTGYDLAILDECAFLKEDVWNEAIRPSLSDKQGKAIFISTPKGKNWFYKLYTQGESLSDFHSWQSWRMPTSVSPTVPPEELIEAKLDIGDAKFAQEYGAEFIDESFNVFANIDECANAEWQYEPIQNHRYIFGIDWGTEKDFTVVTVLDITNAIPTLCFLSRVQKISYDKIKVSIMDLFNLFKPIKIYGEDNSMGKNLNDDLKRNGLPVEHFNTGQHSKMLIINALRYAFNTRMISILNHAVLIDELKQFEETTTRTGMPSYSAPQNKHDDTVMSLAIAHYHASDNIKKFNAIPTNFRHMIGI